MTRRPAAVTQADVERVIRAAKRQGAARITVKVGQAEIAVDLQAVEPAPSTLSPMPTLASRKGRALC